MGNFYYYYCYFMIQLCSFSEDNVFFNCFNYMWQDFDYRLLEETLRSGHCLKMLTTNCASQGFYNCLSLSQTVQNLTIVNSCKLLCMIRTT